MEPFEKIQLAFKCPKALGDLQPCNSNWYCDGCQQMVYDFREKTEKEILDIFAQSGQRLCGIYDANRIKVLPQKRKWYKLVPAAMLMTGLAACSKEISSNYILGEKVIPPLEISEATTVKVDSDMIFGMAVEVVPTFPGGNAGFKNDIKKHLTYSGNYKGRVFVNFVVEQDGSLSDVKIIRGNDPLLNESIIELMKHCPQWNPGIQNGKKYRSVYTVPINVQ